MDDLVGIELAFGERGQFAGGGECGEQREQRDTALRPQPAGVRHLFAKQPPRPERHADIEDAEEQRAADQSEMRHEQDREEDRYCERTEVIEGEYV